MIGENLIYIFNEIYYKGYGAYMMWFKLDKVHVFLIF